MACVFIRDKALSLHDLFGRRSQEVLARSREINQRSSPPSRSPVWTSGIYTCVESPAASVEYTFRVSLLWGWLCIYIIDVSHWLSTGPGGNEFSRTVAVSNETPEQRDADAGMWKSSWFLSSGEAQVSGHSTDNVCCDILP